MKVSEIMTGSPQVIEPDMRVVKAAALMREYDTGILPVGENDKLIGILTDRDIVINAVAEGRDCREEPVSNIMSDDVLYLFDDQDIEAVADNMASNQVRRLPVVNRDKRLVGMVSIGDLAKRGADDAAGGALAAVAQAS